MIRLLLLVTLGVLLTALPEDCPAAARPLSPKVPPVFSVPPSAVRQDDAVRISFAVSAPTDAEVSVLSAAGRVVRRLAAGVLGGENVPSPFGPGLAQEIVWDGQDDAGRAAEGGPFSVRVALGMNVKLDGGAFGSELRPDTLTGATGLACAPDGRLYVMSDRWRQVWWRATSIHAYRRSGEYECTIKPYPAGLPRERLATLTALADEAGRPVPVIYRVLAMSYYPNEDLPQHMTVTPDGNLHFMVRRAGYHGKSRDHGNDRFLASLAPDGAPAYAEYTGPVMASRLAWGDIHLAAASDGRSVFVTGYVRGAGREGQRSADRPNAPAIWRIGLPERQEAAVFYGDPDAQPSSGEGALDDPRGLASDGKGKLFVADRGNDRILIVSEETATLLGSIPTKAPVWVGVHRRTGAVYAAGPDALIKFVAGDDGSFDEQSRLVFRLADRKARGRVRRSFALDAQAEPAVLWLGQNRGDALLLRTEDRGEGFSEPVRAGYGPERSHYWNMSSWPDLGLVSCKVGPTLRIFDEDTGETRDVRLLGSSGQTFRLGPGGQIYGMDHWKWGIRRWDRDGKPMPYEATHDVSDGGRGRTPSQPSGTTAWERDFAIDRAGNVYVKQRGKFYHGRQRVDKYDRDGNFQKTLIWVLSDGALGPRIDPAGNIYIAECVKPPGMAYPEFFQGRLPATRIDKKGDVEQQYRWMYGSVLKFGPAGGAVWFPVLGDNYAYAFDAEPGLFSDQDRVHVDTGRKFHAVFKKDSLPAGQPRMKVDTVSGDRMKVTPGEVQGAEWMRFGCSYLLDMQPSHNRRCHCTATEFEVDDYGRSYYTDQGRFRIVILDTAGNDILAFGRYGNQDSVGPEIAFNWFGGLAVTDRWIYVADIGNRRALRIRKTYAAEESCAIR